jgi:pSer/pThr/pTyr-binding forkhead associated (FHA) protein
MLNIIEYDIPEDTTNYIVLESISSNTSKVIHVIDMAKTFKLFIGRGHDAHVRVTDISVSRLHAILFKASNGYYYLTDNESKFGTLALVRTPLQLMPKMKTQL